MLSDDRMLIGHIGATDLRKTVDGLAAIRDSARQLTGCNCLSCQPSFPCCFPDREMPPRSNGPTKVGTLVQDASRSARVARIVTLAL